LLGVGGRPVLPISQIQLGRYPRTARTGDGCCRVGCRLVEQVSSIDGRPI